MILIVAGSRNIADYDLVSNYIAKIAKRIKIDEIVSGGAKGVDTSAELWAYQNHVPCKVFRAKWDLYGKSAGPRRNEEMAQYVVDRIRYSLDGQGVCLVIRHEVSPGSEHMARTAREWGLQTVEHIVPCE